MQQFLWANYAFQESNIRDVISTSTDCESILKAAALYQLALEEGIELASLPLWTAGYDGPSIIFNRKSSINKIMLKLKIK